MIISTDAKGDHNEIKNLLIIIHEKWNRKVHFLLFLNKANTNSILLMKISHLKFKTILQS